MAFVKDPGQDLFYYHEVSKVRSVPPYIPLIRNAHHQGRTPARPAVENALAAESAGAAALALCTDAHANKSISSTGHAVADLETLHSVLARKP